MQDQNHSGNEEKNSAIPSAESKATPELSATHCDKCKPGRRWVSGSRYRDSTELCPFHATTPALVAERDALKEAVRIAALRLTKLNRPGSPLGEIRDDLYDAFMLAESQSTSEQKGTSPIQ